MRSTRISARVPGVNRETSGDDLIPLDCLPPIGRARAYRWVDIGELAAVEVRGRLYAARGDLADWACIDFGGFIDGPNGWTD